MKLPKSIIICGKTYKVTQNNKVNGACFSCNSQRIEVGTRDTDEKTFESFIHEIIEIVLCEHDLRYQKNRSEIENGDYLFAFNHDQYENAVRDVANALRELYGF